MQRLFTDQSADRGIGGVRPVAPPTWLVSNFLVRLASSWSAPGRSGMPSRQSRGIEPPVAIKRGEESHRNRIIAYLFSFGFFSSVSRSCPTLCDPMNRSIPGLPVHHQLPEFTQASYTPLYYFVIHHIILIVNDYLVTLLRFWLVLPLTHI